MLYQAIGEVSAAVVASFVDVGRSDPHGDCILLPARGAIEGKRQFGSSGYSSELRCRRIGRKILSRRTGHTEEVGGRASGLHRRRPCNRRSAVMWAEKLDARF